MKSSLHVKMHHSNFNCTMFMLNSPFPFLPFCIKEHSPLLPSLLPLLQYHPNFQLPLTQPLCGILYPFQKPK